MTTTTDLPGVRLEHTPSGCQLLHLSTPNFDAVVSLAGGQLLQFQARGALPLLYLSPLATVSPGKAIRGGMPICWPWFGPHAVDPSAPQHGYARNHEWRLNHLATTPQGFELQLIGPTHQDLDCEIIYRFDHGIQAELLTRNRGATAQHYGAALHSYLAVSDAPTVSVHGLADTRYQDKTTGREARHLSDSVQAVGELDRIVYTDRALELLDPGWTRRIRIASQGSESVVLWNPGEQKAQTLRDLPDSGWRSFFCIETANAAEDQRWLAPGATHTLSTRLDTIPL